MDVNALTGFAQPRLIDSEATLQMQPPSRFPLARYRFEWRVTRETRLPVYAGSMLRGAFGHALRRLACVTRQAECAGCRLLCSCPYPALFAPPPPAEHTLQKFSRIPVPYVIEPPEDGATTLQSGDELRFHMVLVGRALKELPLVILAWRRALAHGIGAGDGTAELVRIVHCTNAGEQVIHCPDSGGIAVHVAQIPGPASVPDWSGDAIALRFHTPLRLQENGRALGANRLDPRRLINALVRRISLLSEFHVGTPACADFTALSETASRLDQALDLEWFDWTRYSSRQKQSMALGGLVGTWALRGDLGTLLPWLRLGQWVHVGKEASFGLGRYTLEAVPAESRWQHISTHPRQSWKPRPQGTEREGKRQ